MPVDEPMHYCSKCNKHYNTETEKEHAKEHESLEQYEENLRREKGEGSLLRNPAERESKGTGRKEKAEKEMRKLTQLVKKEVGNVVAEWRDSKADISTDDIYSEFQKRSIAAVGIDMPREQFHNLFEIVRYEEIKNTQTH